MSNAIIRAALESALDTWATGQTLAVAWENRPFAPVTGTTYVRAFLLPAQTDSDDLGRVHRRYVGIFQVSIALPLGTGPGAGEALVTSLAAAFNPTTPILRSGVRVYIVNPVSAAPAILEPDRYVIPCSLTYRADTY